MVPAPCPLKTPGVLTTSNRHARRLALHSMDSSGLMLHLESIQFKSKGPWNVSMNGSRIITLSQCEATIFTAVRPRVLR